MKFELFNMQTGEMFTKTITPLAKAQKFIDKCKYSRKILILGWQYI